MLISKVACADPHNIAPTARMERGMSRRELLGVLWRWERETETFAPYREDLAILRATLTKAIDGPLDACEMPYLEKDGDLIVERPDGSRYRGYVDAISFEKDKVFHPPNSGPVTELGAVFARIVLTRLFVSTLGNPDGEV